MSLDVRWRCPIHGIVELPYEVFRGHLDVTHVKTSREERERLEVAAAEAYVSGVDRIATEVVADWSCPVLLRRTIAGARADGPCGEPLTRVVEPDD